MTQDASEKELYEDLAERVGSSRTGYMPKIIAHAANPRQARILAVLNSVPKQAKRPEQVAEEVGLDVKTVVDDLELMFKRGLAFPRNLVKREEWRYASRHGQLHDSMQCERGTYAPADKDRLHELWRLYDETEGYKQTADARWLRPRATQRVIPAWRSVMNNPNLQPWEDWRAILKEKRVISVVNCSCRPKIKACDKPWEVCMDFDRAAEYDLASGHGRQLTYEEALQVMDDAPKIGLVSQCVNTREIQKSMCNCCDDCCLAIVSGDTYNVPRDMVWAKTRYQATVEQSTCDGCQNCVEQCMFGARSMVKVAGSKKLKAQVDPEKCFGCGLCFVKCEPQSTTMVCVRPEEHVPESLA